MQFAIIKIHIHIRMHCVCVCVYVRDSVELSKYNTVKLKGPRSRPRPKNGESQLITTCNYMICTSNGLIVRYYNHFQWILLHYEWQSVTRPRCSVCVIANSTMHCMFDINIIERGIMQLEPCVFRFNNKKKVLHAVFFSIYLWIKIEEDQHFFHLPYTWESVCGCRQCRVARGCGNAKYIVWTLWDISSVSSPSRVVSICASQPNVASPRELRVPFAFILRPYRSMYAELFPCIHKKKKKKCSESCE